MLSAIRYLLLATLRMGCPIATTGMGACLSERTGVMNLGLEGYMGIGALMAVIGTYFTGNPWIGVLCAIVSGTLISLLYGYVTIICGGVQAVASMALNLFATGFCAVLLRSVFKQAGYTPNVNDLITSKALKGIPVVGDFLASLSPLFYISILILILCHYLLYKTSFGLRMMSCGENPRAADTVGISVNRYRFIGVMISGALGGLGGACLSIGQINLFQEGMIMGRGYLAMGAVIMGKWDPKRVYLAALTFGFFEGLQLYLQLLPNIHIPYELVQAIPYVASVIVLASSAKNVTCPASLGVAYSKISGTK